MKKSSVWAGAIVLLNTAAAFAFGAVYRWAYWPLAALAALLGVAVIVTSKSERRSRVLPAAIVLVMTAIALQLVPLPQVPLAAIAPAVDEFLKMYDFRYLQAGTQAVHALSIRPDQTRLALTLFAAFALLAAGTSRLYSRTALVAVARGVAVAGAALACFALVQNTTFHEGVPKRIYGFWTPLEQGDVFGPFVNKNHFAGWMLMALPFTIGYLLSIVNTEKSDSEHRGGAAWIFSREANEAVLIGMSAATMAVALAMTRSRSGLFGLIAVAILLTFLAVRSLGTRLKRLATIAFLALVVAVAVGRTGVDAFAKRFNEPGAGFSDRLHIWADAWDVAKHFPWTGTGLNTYGTAMFVYQRYDLQHRYDAAHNDYAQLAAEGGLLVAVPAALVAFLFVAAVRKRVAGDRPGTIHWLRMGAIVGIAGVAVQEIGDFSLQIPANACLFATLCGIALFRADRDRSPNRPPVDHRGTMRSTQRESRSMYECPKCKSDEIFRSRSRSRWEAWRKAITGKRLYRCRSCGWRGWTTDLEAEFTRGFDSVPPPPEPPNLAGTGLERRAADDIDLSGIDSMTPGEKR